MSFVPRRFGSPRLRSPWAELTCANSDVFGHTSRAGPCRGPGEPSLTQIAPKFDLPSALRRPAPHQTGAMGRQLLFPTRPPPCVPEGRPPQPPLVSALGLDQVPPDNPLDTRTRSSQAVRYNERSRARSRQRAEAKVPTKGCVVQGWGRSEHTSGKAQGVGARGEDISGFEKGSAQRVSPRRRRRRHAASSSRSH